MQNFKNIDSFLLVYHDQSRLEDKSVHTKIEGFEADGEKWKNKAAYDSDNHNNNKNNNNNNNNNNKFLAETWNRKDAIDVENLAEETEIT